MDAHFSQINTCRAAYTVQKMKFSIKDFFSKCDQIRGKLRVWPHLLKKMENLIFCVVIVANMFIQVLF